MYVPEWFHVTPAGYRDEPWAHCFSAGQLQTGGTAGVLAANQIVRNTPVAFDQDADMIVRGLAVDAPGNFRPFSFQWRDAWGNQLSDALIGQQLYFTPAGVTPAKAGGWIAVWTPPIFVPAGGVILFDVQNNDNVPLAFPDIEFRGYKRFREVCQ